MSQESQSNAYNAAAAHYERQQQQQHHDHQTQPIETIYTTVESDPDRTDWLTVVSNLRQANRQLVEEIARLEQTLASTKQSLHTHKEQNQSHEITILQQQNEIGIAHDRLGSIFQQLETSHQIGQRQQTLIETLSQQLEIVQTIVPQLEAEHEELTHKYQQQSQKLTKTEQVATELHRRLQLLDTTKPEYLAAVKDSAAAVDLDLIVAEILVPEVEDQSDHTIEIIEVADHHSDPTSSELDALDSTPKFDPAPPRSPLQIAQAEIARWTPAAPNMPSSWRQDLASNPDYAPTLDDRANIANPAAEIADKESNAIDDPALTWPAPTLDPDNTTSKKIKIDLPRFPKKSTK
jgi:hypothetical protein